jgi:hypothetical protein
MTETAIVRTRAALIRPNQIDSFIAALKRAGFKPTNDVLVEKPRLLSMFLEMCLPHDPKPKFIGPEFELDLSPAVNVKIKTRTDCLDLSSISERAKRGEYDFPDWQPLPYALLFFSFQHTSRRNAGVPLLCDLPAIRHKLSSSVMRVNDCFEFELELAHYPSNLPALLSDLHSDLTEQDERAVREYWQGHRTYEYYLKQYNSIPLIGVDFDRYAQMMLEATRLAVSLIETASKTNPTLKRTKEGNPQVAALVKDLTRIVELHQQTPFVGEVAALIKKLKHIAEGEHAPELRLPHELETRILGLLPEICPDTDSSPSDRPGQDSVSVQE